MGVGGLPQPGEVLELPSGIKVVAVDEETCELAKRRGVWTATYNGVCVVRLEDAPRLGLVPSSDRRESTVVFENPWLRFNDIVVSVKSARRKRGERRLQTSITLPEHVLRKVERLAKQYGTSTSAMVEALLLFAFEKLGM